MRKLFSEGFSVKTEKMNHFLKVTQVTRSRSGTQPGHGALQPPLLTTVLTLPLQCLGVIQNLSVYRRWGLTRSQAVDKVPQACPSPSISSATLVVSLSSHPLTNSRNGSVTLNHLPSPALPASAVPALPTITSNQLSSPVSFST